MEKLELYLGLDVGSVSINLVLLDNEYNVLEKLYLRTRKPIEVLSDGLEKYIKPCLWESDLRRWCHWQRTGTCRCHGGC